MSRDIDQEVSDTLSTLLNFDEDNFLSQDEVEENLRNCLSNDHVGDICGHDDDKGNHNYDDPSGAGVNNHLNDTNSNSLIKQVIQEGHREEDVAHHFAKTEREEVSDNCDKLDSIIENAIGINVGTTLQALNAEDVVTGEISTLKETTAFKTKSGSVTINKLEPLKDQSPDLAFEKSTTQTTVKMEFTCESEQIFEEDMGDYYIEHDAKSDVNFNCGSPQVQMGCENEAIDRNGSRSINNTGVTQEKTQDSSLSVDKEYNHGPINNEADISCIMNDHNYTFQERITDGDGLRKLLLTHILSKTNSSTAGNLVTDFVDRTLESIDAFSIGIDHKKTSDRDTINLIDIFSDENTSGKAVFDKSLKNFSSSCSGDENKSTNALPILVQNGIESTTLNISSISSTHEILSEPLEHAIDDNFLEKLKDSGEPNSEGKSSIDSSHINTPQSSLKDKNVKISEHNIDDELENILMDVTNEENCQLTLEKAKSENNLSISEHTSLDSDVPKTEKFTVFCKKLCKMDIENSEETQKSEELDTTEEFLHEEKITNNSNAVDCVIETLELKNLNVGVDGKDNSDFKTMNILSVPSPLENCSEPMEHSTFDEAFDINCNEKLTVIHHLEALRTFAKSLQNDCETFNSSTTTIESKLQKYLQEKFEIFKKIVKTSSALRSEEKSIQTDTRLSRHKLRKLNQNNKNILLEPDSSSYSDDSHSESLTKYQGYRARTKSFSRRSKVDAATEIFYGNKKESIAAEYDDGVPLVEYTQSEIFETETFCSESFSNIRNGKKKDNFDDSTESGENGTWQRKKGNAGNNSPRNETSPNESDKENSAGKPMSCTKNSQNDDKEIERLINLNGLIKRTSVGAPKSADLNEKVKTKSSISKSKDIAEIYSDDEIQQETFSDMTISESEEEIITEKQFLERCNENVKKQLLSDTDSDMSDSGASDNIEEIFSSNEGSESPLLERFLKKFNVDESDEETEKYDELNNDTSIKEQEASDAKNTSLDKNKANSSENSDCEVLDMDIVSATQKQIKPKSLEKMLSVVEKRKKMNRLCDSISLSSESESSDVEAVDESKSRIKPMLRPEQLATVTREAQRNETERIRRLEKKHKVLTKLLKERPDVQDDNHLILDYNEETKTFIKVHPDIAKHLKQHQRDGVKFMYDSCYGGVEALKKSSGSGCILAHCMGLGKTLQLIALLHTVISYKELKTSKVLVLCPKSTVMNWADEIDRWLGPLKPKYYTFHDTSDINDKIQILKDWSMASPSAAGILLIGYEAFRTLVFYHSYKNRSIAQSRLENIRNDVDKYLLSPGADLVVCDEGHIIKNSKSAISLAVSQIKTQKRIVLTGTPIQNNLKEYYSMVNFIKPLFLGTEKEFANLYANPIKNGQHKDSSKRDIQVMKQRSFVLHKKLSKFVQRKEAELLKTFLPQKYEYVLFVPMTKVQAILYEHILAIISKKEDRGKGLITDYTCLRKIWTHPKVLEDAWKNAMAQKHRKDPKACKNQAVNSDDDQPDDVYDSQTGVISVTNDWWRSLLTEKDLETILPSNKLRTMFEILRMCEEKGEKCLIFSAFVAVLNVVEYFFKKMNDKDPDTLKELKMSQGYQVKNTWILGKDYYRLDGKTPKLIRHEMIEQFNSISNKRARVFLISSRAGGQGINLTGANRVIILDTSWNPSNDQQNIFRVFRLGQKKNCYIYRLLAMGTMEEKVYSRSVTKQAMSFRVVDEQQIDRHYSMAELTELYSLTMPDYENRPMPDCPQDTILASLLLNYPNLVYKYHEHDSLLENKVEQELSEQEKQDAWAAYERDQQLNSETRELPNPDDLQSNLTTPKFPSYMSSLPAFNQMSALFNYGNYSSAALSTYLPYLSHLGNYATNPQYLEMRKRIAEGAFAYPDISTSLGAASFGAPFGQNPPKSMPSNPLMPDLPIHSNPLQTNPLSALGDLSMFGLGNVNNHMAHNVNATTLPQRQHNSPPFVSTSPATANSLQSNYDYQMYENSLKSLVNYRHDFSGNGNKSKSSTNAAVNQFRNPLFPSPTNLSFDKNTLTSLSSHSPSPKAMEHPTSKSQADKTSANQQSSPDISLPLNASTRNETTSMNKNNFSAANTSSARNSPLPQATATKRSFPSEVSLSNTMNPIEGRLTPNQKSAKDALQSSMASFQSYKNNINASSSSGMFTNKNTVAKISTDTIKTNSEMQIIPTTSSPGSLNVTKQFGDISPSISLTAVTNVNTGSNIKKTPFNQSKTQIKNPAINKATTNSNNNITTELAASSKPFSAAGTFFESSKKTATATHTASKPALTMTKTKRATPDSILKSAPSVSAQNVYQKNATDIAPKLLTSSVNTKNKNILQRKQPENMTMQQLKSPAPTSLATSLATGKNLNGTPKATVAAKPSQSLQSDARKSVLSMEKRLPTIISTTQSASGIQIHKAPSASGTLKIQPTSSKQSAASSSSSAAVNDNKSILESCINQKKFVIGANTKGGGGTTVTRVQQQGKRKMSDIISKGISSMEAKRSKLQ
uniref:Helicase ARIP4 n=1 Tax=Ceratitis capitata TaxID=7213 RepID=W8AIW8_CERCA